MPAARPAGSTTDVEKVPAELATVPPTRNPALCTVKLIVSPGSKPLPDIDTLAAPVLDSLTPTETTGDVGHGP